VNFDVDTAAMDGVLRHLAEVGVRSLVSQPPTLEELFLRHYTAPNDSAPNGERSGAKVAS
jgi:ABC-2 type transport system ATP-binding protein